MTVDQNQLELDKLDKAMHATLEHYFAATKALKSKAMEGYDPGGKTAFVLVAFNHPNESGIEERLGPEEAAKFTAEDRAVAVSASTTVLMPEVIPNAETGTIGPPETMRHGVQAAAAAMLLSSLQNGAVYECCTMAQSAIARQRRMQ
ncbi:MAG: hypothetical protein DRI24_17930 [Deltaproteobacteria bacterium]|nr:MAG: hypothetical protein DRI24_17930 [Deltaproteobacteria bacterium]